MQKTSFIYVAGNPALYPLEYYDPVSQVYRGAIPRLLADFAAYCQAEQRMAETYRDQTAWNRMSLHNIARSGVFAADRAVAEYADNIWHVPHK